MKSILINDQLHSRLRNYTKSQNILIGKYVESCIEMVLNADELQADKSYKDLQHRWSSLIKKAHLDSSILDSDEYRQLMIDNKNYFENSNNL